MKVGIITDIHNNLMALKAVVAKFDQYNCDKVICLGDIIGIGPYPEETVQYTMKIPNLIAVRGNHERYLTDGMPEEYPNEEQMEYAEMQHHKWEHSMLSESSIEFLKTLSDYEEIEVEGYKITAMHYCMDHTGRYVNYTPNPSETDLIKMFSDIDSDVILYGHNHRRTICKSDSKYYINVGSLGCPAQEQNIARAGVLMIQRGQIHIEPVDIEYDAGCVIREIDKLNYPDAENIKKYFYGIW